MTKDKYIYELIDKCMLITWQDNILVENFELRDDSTYYSENEKQFYNCIKFFDKMEEMCRNKKIDDAVMDQELKSVLALMRQSAMRNLLNDFKIYLEHTTIPDKKKKYEELETELQRQDITSEYIIKKIKEYRNLEQN